MADFDGDYGKSGAEAPRSFNSQYRMHRDVAEMKNQYRDADCMFDSLTALPSFDLFEDRLQTAINGEISKDLRLKRAKIAVVGLFLDNLSMFDEREVRRMLLRKTGEKLAAALPENYTVARGINYHFWVMMPNMPGDKEIALEVQKIQSVVLQPIVADFAEYRLLCSIGASVFNGGGMTAKQLVEEAIMALQKAQSDGENNIEFFASN